MGTSPSSYIQAPPRARIASRTSKTKILGDIWKISKSVLKFFHPNPEHELPLWLRQHLKVWQTISSLLSEFFIQKEPCQVLVILVQMSVHLWHFFEPLGLWHRGGQSDETVSNRARQIEWCNHSFSLQFIAPIHLYWCYVIVRIWKW